MIFSRVNRLVPTSQALDNRHRTLLRGGVTGILIACAFTASSLNAQDFTGQSFRLGETNLTPELRLDYVSLDNAFRTANDQAETEATGFLVLPSLNWQAERRQLQLSATYRGNYGVYSESLLDYNDHDLRGRAEAEFGARHRAFAEVSFLREHDAPGTGQTSFLPDVKEPIVTTSTGLQAEYTFGALSARGNVGGGIAVRSISYSDLGTVTQGDDYSRISPFVYFSYRISPDTRFRVEARFEDLDYDFNARDRSENRFLVGLDLAATERTGGVVRVGITKADFAQSDAADTTEAIAGINLYYRPRNYSRFDLRLNREFTTVDEDPNGIGESIVDDLLLSWRHEWNSRIATLTRYGRKMYDRTCPNRDYAVDTLGVEFSVGIRRWIAVGAGIQKEMRSANDCSVSGDSENLDYDLTTFGVHVTATL